MPFVLRSVPRSWVFVLVLLLPGVVRGQAPGDQSLIDLKSKAASFKNPSVNDLLKGAVEADPNSEHHKGALEAEARLMAHRIYFDEAHKPTAGASDTADSIHKIFVDYERDIALLADKDKAMRLENARKMFTHSILELGKEVLKKEMGRRPAPRPIVVMNTVRMMARTADLGMAETAEVLAAVLRNPPAGNQGAQYWAARGLRDLLEKSPEVLGPPQMDATAQALADFIDKRVTFTEGAPLQEIDGYRSLRREAIRALALTGQASGSKGKPAWVLVKVMSAYDITPKPRMDERAEAAIGVARMRGKNADYRTDYAAQLIVAFVRDFATFYQTDYKSGKSGLPCKILAARLGDELKLLKDQAGDMYVSSAVDKLLDPLAAMEGDRAVSSDQLRQWLDGNKAPNQVLFKSDPYTTVVRKWWLS
jgi:hypothetical protein